MKWHPWIQLGCLGDCWKLPLWVWAEPTHQMLFMHFEKITSDCNDLLNIVQNDIFKKAWFAELQLLLYFGFYGIYNTHILKLWCCFSHTKNAVCWWGLYPPPSGSVTDGMDCSLSCCKTNSEINGHGDFDPWWNIEYITILGVWPPMQFQVALRQCGWYWQTCETEMSHFPSFWVYIFIFGLAPFHQWTYFDDLYVIWRVSVHWYAFCIDTAVHQIDWLIFIKARNKRMCIEQKRYWQ